MGMTPNVVTVIACVHFVSLFAQCIALQQRFPDFHSIRRQSSVTSKSNEIFDSMSFKRLENEEVNTNE